VDLNNPNKTYNDVENTRLQYVLHVDDQYGSDVDDGLSDVPQKKRMLVFPEERQKAKMQKQKSNKKL